MAACQYGLTPRQGRDMTLEEIVFFVDANRKGENHLLRTIDMMLTQKLIIVTNAQLKKPGLKFEDFTFFKQPQKKKSLKVFYDNLKERIENAKKALRD